MSVFNIDNLPSETQQYAGRSLIMLIDDEQENLNVLQLLLESDYQIVTALSAMEALSIIDEMEHPEQIKLIICDHRMPGLTGVEFFERIVPKIPDTKRIILTGFSDTQAIIDSINKAKLYNFVTKPFDPSELKITVQRGVEAFDMHKKLIDYTQMLEEKVKSRTEELNAKNVELERALKEMERLSLTDQLTGANNRHFLQRFIDQEIASLKRGNFNESEDKNTDIGILLFDIDNFKAVNDCYGHDAGDSVLIQMVEILRDACRESDWVVRWGGEEFLVVSRFVNRDELHHLAERIRAKVADFSFKLADCRKTSLTISCGITAFPFVKSAFDAFTWQQTIKLADVGLYAAKNSGRNGWVKLSENQIEDATNLYDRILEDINLVSDSGDLVIESSFELNALKFS